MDEETLLFAKAIADETRQQILQLICCQWLSVNEIVSKLSLTQPTISHHLAILRDAGLLLSRQEGRYTFYTLNQKHLAICCGKVMSYFAPQHEMTSLIQKRLSMTS